MTRTPSCLLTLFLCTCLLLISFSSMNSEEISEQGTDIQTPASSNIPIVCNPQFKPFFPQEWIESGSPEDDSSPFHITWKEQPRSPLQQDTFICSLNQVEWYVNDTHLYYLLGYMSTYFTSTRVVGHMFQESFYRKAQALYFKGIRRKESDIRLLSTPIKDSNLRDTHRTPNKFSQPYKLAERQMDAGADVIFLHFNHLMPTTKVVAYTNQTNQKLIIWKHPLQEIPVQEEKVIARVVIDMDPFMEELLKQRFVKQEFPPGVKVNRIFDARDIFSLEWSSWVREDFRKDVEAFWDGIENGNEEKNLKDLKPYKGYELLE